MFQVCVEERDDDATTTTTTTAAAAATTIMNRSLITPAQRNHNKKVHAAYAARSNVVGRVVFHAKRENKGLKESTVQSMLRKLLSPGETGKISPLRG